MKRVISLMLCLVMILGLLTGLAAAQENGAQTSLVASRDLTGIGLDGNVEFTLTLNGKAVDQNYDVFLTEPGIGELYYDQINKIWVINPQSGYPQKSGDLVVVLPDGIGVGIPVSTQQEPLYGLYTAASCDATSYIPFHPTAEISFATTSTAYVRVANNGFVNPSVTATSAFGSANVSVGTAQKDADWCVWPITVSGNTDLALVQIRLTWGEGSSASWTLKDSEDVLLDMGAVPTDQNAQFGTSWSLPIEHDGETYYLNLGTPNGPDVSGASGMYPFMNVITLPVAAYYYKLVNKGDGSMQEVSLTDGVDDRQLAQILTRKVVAEYGTLSIHLYPANPNVSAQAPVIEPVEPNQVEQERYADRAVYTFDVKSSGNYILTLDAEKDAQKKTLSCAWLQMDGMRQAITEVSSVEAAEEFLNRYVNVEEKMSLSVRFTGDEVSGQLDIPAVPGIVNIYGKWGGRTTVKGGVCVTAGTTVGLNGLYFQGDATKKTSEYLDDAKTVPNSALYGTGGAWLWNCVIDGYYYGVRVDEKNTMMNFGGGEGTEFKNNHVGIYVNYSSQYAGMDVLDGYTFRNNGTAIKIDNLDIGALGNQSMNALTVKNGIFINNTVDVENNDEEVLWMPMCYFVHGDENAHKHSDKQSAHWQPVIKPTAKKHQVPAVIASPAACAPSCLVSDGYYYPKHIYVSDDIRELYPIDALESGMAVTAVDDSNKAIATVELTSTAPAVNPTAAQAGTYSLRRLAAPMLLADEETTAAFDSVMEKSETDSKITLTIGAMPEGYAGTVTVECGSDLAYVYHEGKMIASTLSDGYVSFAAVQSTKRETYEIKKVDASDDGIVIPQTPAKKDESEPSVDVTEVYSDVAADDWFCDAVEFVTEQGLMNGMGEGSFAPGENLSRAMMWTMLARLDGADTEGGENWYDKGLAWAKANGVSDGSAPNGSITREQLVTMLWRFEGEPKADLKVLDGYADADKLSDYARQAMAWAVSKGVIRGQGDDILAPVGQATRAEVAQIFYNYLAKLTAAGGKRDAL